MHFNGDVLAPVLFDGWETLRDFFHITEDVRVRIAYFGNYIFRIRILNVISNTDQYP
ncbi:hypothetical protein RYX36_005153, partial [Vicia faba]